MWRDNPALVECFDNWCAELQCIANDTPYYLRDSFRSRRIRAGLTQIQLSKIAELNVATISAVENGGGGTFARTTLDKTLTRLEIANY